jgi:hypothetical protein
MSRAGKCPDGVKGRVRDKLGALVGSASVRRDAHVQNRPGAGKFTGNIRRTRPEMCIPGTARSLFAPENRELKFGIPNLESPQRRPAKTANAGRWGQECLGRLLVALVGFDLGAASRTRA